MTTGVDNSDSNNALPQENPHDERVIVSQSRNEIGVLETQDRIKGLAAVLEKFGKTTSSNPNSSDENLEQTLHTLEQEVMDIFESAIENNYAVSEAREIYSMAKDLMNMEGAVLKGYHKRLDSDGIWWLKNYYELFKDVLASQTDLKQGIIAKFREKLRRRDGDIKNSQKELEEWLSDPVFLDPCFVEYFNEMNKAGDIEGLAWIKELAPRFSFTLDVEHEKSVRVKFLKILCTKDPNYTDELAPYYAGKLKQNTFPEADFSSEITQGLVLALEHREVYRAKRIMEIFPKVISLHTLITERQIQPYFGLLPILKKEYSTKTEEGILQMLFDQRNEWWGVLGVERVKFCPQMMVLKQNHNLPLIWQHHLLSIPTKEGDPGFEPEKFLAKSNGERAEYLWHYLRQTPILGEEEKINYEKGAAIFGHGVMQIYTGMGDRRRFHDCLQGIDDIINLYQQSGRSARDFGGSILAQIGTDKSMYGESDEKHRSWIEMDIIAQELAGVDLNTLLEEGRTHAEIEEINHHLEGFDSVSSIFENWKSLKQFYELAQILKNTELLASLNQLKEEGEGDPVKAALYRYGTTLGFHPAVSLQHALLFMNDPQAFLEEEAKYTNSELHNKLSPGQYTQLPHLDLSAEEMRDMLVSGQLEAMQTFPPMEMEFHIPADPEYARLNSLAIVDLIREAAGSYKEKLEGKAIQPKQIIPAIGGILKEKREGKAKALALKLVKGELEPPVTSEEEESIRGEILFSRMGFGFRRGVSDVAEEFKAMVTSKSDPLGVVAGNDMANCMPFGDGKTTQYTYSPGCNFFLVQKKNTEGQWRTVSQALLTENIKVSPANEELETEEGMEGNPQEEEKSSPILNGINNKVLKNNKLREILKESILDQNTPSQIIVDSVEVANNFIATEKGLRQEGDRKNIRNLEYIYSSFFSSYLSKLRESAAKEGRILDDSELITAASERFNPLENLERVPNHSIPITTLSYLDNKLPFTEKIPVHPDQSQAVEIPKKTQPIAPLTWRDSLQAAWIQEGAYGENPPPHLGLAEIQNSLIAQAMNNQHKKRPNMSLKYVDDQGMMRGYLNAYEGRTSDDIGSLSKGSPVIYMEDFAHDSGNDLAGKKMILEFLELYKQNYIDAEKPVPIYVGFRDETTYQAIEEGLNAMAKRLGKKVRKEDLGEDFYGHDAMHSVVFFVE